MIDLNVRRCGLEYINVEVTLDDFTKNFGLFNQKELKGLCDEFRSIVDTLERCLDE